MNGGPSLRRRKGAKRHRSDVQECWPRPYRKTGPGLRTDEARMAGLLSSRVGIDHRACSKHAQGNITPFSFSPSTLPCEHTCLIRSHHRLGRVPVVSRVPATLPGRCPATERRAGLSCVLGPPLRESPSWLVRYRPFRLETFSIDKAACADHGSICPSRPFA